MRESDPHGSCLVGSCTRAGTMRMRIGPTLGTAGGEEADFCESCAPHYEPVWKRVEPNGQMELEL
jgi:hypothetical protein